MEPSPAQSATAWQLYQTGGITPGGDHQPGSVNYPRFAVPGKPSEAGSYIIDQAGKLRVAGDNDDGAPQKGRTGDAFDDDGSSPNGWADIGRSVLNAPEHFVPDLVGQLGNARGMINSAEEGVMMLFGENMALGLMLKALIATHPNPKALREIDCLTNIQPCTLQIGISQIELLHGRATQVGFLEFGVG